MLRVRITSKETPTRVAVLCDSPDPIPRHNLRLNGQPVLELADLFRATYGKVFDRKNRRPRLSFDAIRDSNDNGEKFITSAEATAFALDHVYMDCPTSGDVELEIGGEDGSSVTRWLRGAGVEQLGMTRQVGRTLYFGYAIVGGTYEKARS